jgi:hypothetical protein
VGLARVIEERRASGLAFPFRPEIRQRGVGQLQSHPGGIRGGLEHVVDQAHPRQPIRGIVSPGDPVRLAFAVGAPAGLAQRLAAGGRSVGRDIAHLHRGDEADSLARPGLQELLVAAVIVERGTGFLAGLPVDLF